MTKSAGRILVTLSTFCEDEPAPRQLLVRSGFAFVENTSGRRMTPEEILAAGTDWIGLVAGVEPYKAETLAQMPALRCISRVGIGLDAIDLMAAKARGIVVRNTPDAPVAAVAEMTVAQMLDLLKRLTWHAALMRQKKWSKKTGSMLEGRTVGLIGTGRIGRAVAARLVPFGVKLLGADPAPDAVWAATVGLEYCGLAELLTSADVVSLHASRPAADGPVLGAAEIARMKPGAILINTARGHLVDAAALEAALRSGALAGAGLDVFPEEPYAGGLCELDNVVLTPHIATLTSETRRRMEMEAVENLLEELK
jgi:D-3-phosphoglycerate dehydrogenase